jgi:hypothetical protein
MRKISLRQRVIASDLPVNLCLIVGQTLGLLLMFQWLQPNLELLRDPWYVAQVLFSLFATSVLSWMGSLMAAFVLFGSLLDSQEIRNGGPFVVGDRVRIVAGRNAGELGKVTSCGQGRTVGVKIDGNDSDVGGAVYSHYQLLREYGYESSPGHEQTDV